MCGKQGKHSVQNEDGLSYAVGQKEDSRALSVVAEQGPQSPQAPLRLRQTPGSCRVSDTSWRLQTRCATGPRFLVSCDCLIV